ncbi:hypothetical protein PbJCM13498_32390 [Prolixibacter bellariivorans]|uniref:Macroglobulin domain-containing protein n=2 Tax=Prolixibacter bellariivorans TaxID=314319 RepID=A0A5M4B3E0_9BACT|nr:hypothetical protein PbJCM13498_32390 [Prolixibacter bellariivorans]
MKIKMKTLVKLLVASVTLFVVALPLNSRAADKSAGNEKVAFVTDRDFYTAGEDLYFKACNLSDSEMAALEWSKVLYVELIDGNANPVVREKFTFGANGTDGKITIPEVVPSGYYYVMAYTRWMRNFPASGFAWKTIKILNPYSEEVVSGEDSLKMAANKNWHVAKDSIAHQTFKRRQNVSLNLTLPHSDGPTCVSTVSVVRKGSHVAYHQPTEVRDPDYDKVTGDTITFIPETRGVSVNGRVINKNTGRGVSYARINLSVLGGEGNFHGTYSRADGVFHFAIPEEYGKRELFMSVEKDSVPCKLLVDNDFIQRKLEVPNLAFKLTSDERKLAERMMISQELASNFTLKTPLDSGKTKKSEEYFFGQPVFHTDLDKYIKLPTLEEVFYELVPSVVVVRHRGVPRFFVSGNHSDLHLYPPLVLLDRVPLSDMKNILSIPPERIKSIDVVNATYQRGDVIYGGIISMKSRLDDLAGIDLPESSFFLEFQTLDKADSLHALNDVKGAGLPNIPMMGNTLYWNSDAVADKNDQVHVAFDTGDETGDFEVWLTSVTTDGKVFEKCVPITITR